MAMPWLYLTICGLLENLTSLAEEEAANATVRHWFAEHIPDLGLSQDILALLSCLLPGRRHDRTYGLSQKRIIDMVVQAHAIGTSRKQALEMIVDRGSADCGTALATTLNEGRDSKPYYRPLMVIELDSLLDSAAACCRFSDASLRRNTLT